jgi:hypothetical protein
VALMGDDDPTLIEEVAALGGRRLDLTVIVPVTAAEQGCALG